MILVVAPASAANLILIGGGGVALGLVMLVRGMAGYRAAGRISGTSTSRISSLAVGEVLVSGTAEPIELTLISPLQSTTCVYYRARISGSRDERGGDVFREERAVGFRVRDASGAIRVFPNGARFDVPDSFDETADWSGSPIGLLPRTGSIYAPGPDDREARVADLLTVKDPRDWSLLDRSSVPSATRWDRAHFREARIEPGALVTVIGRALPFSELDDPSGANLLDGTGAETGDPEIAADLAAAREAGLLAPTAEAAWGNAAIEGFGIGRPVRSPELDPAANRPPPADPDLAARATAAFDIAPNDLILAASQEVPMVVSLGGPTQVAARADRQFVLGLGGAILAIAAAMGIALVIQSGMP